MRYLIAILLLLCAAGAKAQDDVLEKTNILFVVDGSSSMLKNWGKENKWSIAKKTLTQIADSLQYTYPNLEFGLRVYGHQSLPIKSNCQDTELKLPIAKNSVKALEQKLNEVSPKGITPVAYTLEQVQYDFAGKSGEKNILILITDGAESCLGDPCAILGMLIQNEIIVKPVVIGLDIPIASLQAFNCVKDVHNPKNEKELSESIMRLIHQSIRYTTLQVNLLRSDDRPTQTNIPMLMYEDKSNILHYSMYHRLNSQGQPDTLLVDPAPTYRIEVQTVPPVISEPFKLSASQHNEVNLKVATGVLQVNFVDKQGKKIAVNPTSTYFIKKQGSATYLKHHKIGLEQTLLEGVYQIDVATIPPLHFEDVTILDKQTEAINIPAPGKVILNAKYPIHGGVFQKVNNELINIFTFQTNTKQEILDLQPGSYSIIYRFDHKRNMMETIEIKLQIESSEIKEINI